MAKPLTPIAIANLKARPQRYEVSDPGCAGLRVVVFPSKRSPSSSGTDFAACSAS